jgi:N-acetylneuraminate synthase
MTFIIAECGINHSGSLDLAKRLIDAAKWAGADAVKFQKRTVEIVYAGHLDDPRESPWGKTLGEQKRGLEFGRDEYDAIARHCEMVKMPWFASAWDIPSLEFLAKYNCPYNKIASAMVTNIDFIIAVAEERKPTFISTAMTDIEGIGRTISAWTDKEKKKFLTLMHCVGTYPTPEEDLNLRMIQTLKDIYGLPVGYSGHEASHSPTVMAVVLGAVAIERHITLDKSMYGSDQAASLEPVQFWHLVNEIRKVPIVLGDGVKRITEGEKAVARKLRYWEAS